jgi:RNA-directed DNA polymerase
MDISTVTHLFVPLMKRGLNCYEHKDRLHLEARALQIARKGEKGLRKILIQRDQGICLVCHTSLISSNENVELHHLTPQKQAGGWTLDNLVLLHTTCHKKVTYDEVLNQNLKSQICREPAE